ncbi:uncharacterized protein [Antedon mediterranea]|uniref:uncharacterized protein isoform X2 n=1 Tax=Antedon mediterranea TaxID=105859 RepID=UPI003AF89F4E
MNCTILVFLVCLILCATSSAGTKLDTRGHEFLIAFANNYDNTHGPSVILTNDSPKMTANVTINIKYVDTLNITVYPESFQRVALPVKVISTKRDVPFPAVHIKSDVRITVFGLNDAHQNAVGGFLALPLDTLGTSYVAGTQSPWLASQIVMVAVEDNTRVKVCVSHAMRYDYDEIPAGRVISFDLNKFEALMFEGLADLTGSIISSDRNIAVFSGNRAAKRPNHRIDHTVEQLTPFKTWGKQFILVPYSDDDYSWNAFRVVVRNKTRLIINTTNSNTNQVEIDVGNYHEITLNGNITSFIVADYPVSIFHYAQTKKNGNKGTDMSINNVSPIGQYIDVATFTTFNEANNFTLTNLLTIITRCDAINQTTIDASRVNFFRETVNSAYCFAHASIPHKGLHFVNGSGFFSVLHSFTATSSYAFPIALGQEPKNCKTFLSNGSIYEHGCHQEVVPVNVIECPQSEVALEAEADESCGRYTSLQVFVIALFSAGGAICIDLIIRCFKEATEPPKYADAKGNKKWTTSISELRERRRAIRVRSMENEFQQQTKEQQENEEEKPPPQDDRKPSIVVEGVVSVPMDFSYPPPPSPRGTSERIHSNLTSENESDGGEVESESDTNSYVSLAYNESKV